MMNTNDFKNNEGSLRNMISGFIESYAQRDKNVEFSQWLADCLRQEIPDMAQEASKSLADKIIGAVAEYDYSLNDLNLAIDAGQSKNEWLAGQLSEACHDMPLDAVGGKLQLVESEFASFNFQLIEGERPSRTAKADGPISWNKYTIRDTAYGIGDQSNFMGQAVAASALGNTGDNDVPDAIKKLLQAALKAVPQEVKAVVAGAIQAAAERGLTDLLPDDVPTESICGMAGMAVECAKALLDAADGEISMMAVLEKISRAGIAVGCCAGRYALEGRVLSVPFGGPILVDLLGGLLDHMESSKFQENVYTLLRDAVDATWQGIKESETVKTLQQVLQKVKETALN